MTAFVYVFVPNIDEMSQKQGFAPSKWDIFTPQARHILSWECGRHIRSDIRKLEMAMSLEH
jgi:hypothetical protein